MPIIDLIKETCEDLINLHRKNPTRAKFLFPSGMLSEKEARRCFAASVERGTEYRYMAETPDKEPCNFSDTGMTDTQTNLSLWSLDGEDELSKIIFRTDNPGEEKIDSDIYELLSQKLKYEYGPSFIIFLFRREMIQNKKIPEAVWFHLLLNEDSGTFRTLAQKFTVAVDKQSETCLKDDPTWKKNLLFAVCSVENGVGMAGELSLPAANVADIKNFFDDGATFLLDPDMRTKGNWQVLVRDREL